MNTVVIDCGHGGVDLQGKYRTAPAKMFTFPNGEVAYEGVYNRLIGKELETLLKKSYDVFYTVAPNNPMDLSLKNRVTITNMFPSFSTILISLHSNASSSHNARGFEVYTSVGETKSDKLAHFIGGEIQKSFPNNRFRKDMSDGDLDKESNFYVLRKSNCSAILLESLFFDNYEYFKLLKDKDFRF